MKYEDYDRAVEVPVGRGEYADYRKLVKGTGNPE